jgi:hypothetical protein
MLTETGLKVLGNYQTTRHIGGNGKAGMFYLNYESGIGVLDDIDTFAWHQAQRLKLTAQRMGGIACHKSIFTAYIDLIECHETYLSAALEVRKYCLKQPLL